MIRKDSQPPRFSHSISPSYALSSTTQLPPLSCSHFTHAHARNSGERQCSNHCRNAGGQQRPAPVSNHSGGPENKNKSFSTNYFSHQFLFIFLSQMHYRFPLSSNIAIPHQKKKKKKKCLIYKLILILRTIK
jgi:hypothetical protein